MRKLTVRARAQEWTKDTGAARLLEQIHFRYKGAIAKGKTSTPQSYHDLMRDTRFTFKMVKRALRVLRAGGFIEAEQHLFLGKNVCHYVIPGQVMLALEGQLPMDPGGQLPMDPEGQLYITGTSPGTSSGTSLVSHSLDTAPGENLTIENLAGEEGEEKEMKGLKSVRDVEAAVKAKKVLHKPDTPTYYGGVWREALVQAGHFCPALFPKDLKLLKRIADKCQPVSGEKVIRFAVANWSKFTAQAKIDAAFGYTAPKTPLMTFLLNHVATAATMTITANTPKQQEAKLAICDAKLGQLTSQQPAPEAPKMSYAELWADPTDDEED